MLTVFRIDRVSRMQQKTNAAIRQLDHNARYLFLEACTYLHTTDTNIFVT